jgi:hypothetical protein
MERLSIHFDTAHMYYNLNAFSTRQGDHGVVEQRKLQ